MKLRWLIHIPAFSLWAFLMWAVPVSAQELLVAYEEYPPYEYTEYGIFKGCNADLAKEAFKRIGFAPVFEIRPWKRALYEIEHGEILALMSGFKTPERETIAYFPSEPLAMETNVVIGLAGSGLVISSLDDLRDLRIGVVREYVYGGGFDAMKGLTKIKTNSSPQMLRMLLNNRTDVLIGNKRVIRHLAKKMRQETAIETLYEIASEPLYLYFSRAQGREAEALARDFGLALRSMREDGTYASILEKY